MKRNYEYKMKPARYSKNVQDVRDGLIAAMPIVTVLVAYYAYEIVKFLTTK